jgi:protein-S-isoprenylcysteine O-methyltransferase Ste14
MARLLWTCVGVGAHILLAVTVWFLFPFLMDGRGAAGSAAAPLWWCFDALLTLQFGVGHSLLLLPRVRNRLECIIPRPLYGCMFTAMTCLSLLLVILAWQPSGLIVYRLEGWADTGMRTAYCLSWAGLLYTLGLTGYGWQTGWTPFWAWLHDRQPPPRRFTIPGAYRLVRHPVYLAFLAQVWLTPVMTLDRLLLCSVFTVYILLGSYLKDRRLVFYLGDTYRQYQARVPGYPLMLGPLGRVPLPRPAASSAADDFVGRRAVAAGTGGRDE